MPEMETLEKRLLMGTMWRGLTQHVTLPWILRWADLPPAARALEVGSGAGFNAEIFLRRFPGWHLTASDYDPQMVERAARRLAGFGERVDVRHADAVALPFPDQSFDVVVSILVWHHVGDWRAATHQAARVLKEGGTLLLVDLTEGFFPAPVARLFPPATRYHANEVRPALTDAGFRSFKVARVGSLLYRALAKK